MKVFVLALALLFAAGSASGPLGAAQKTKTHRSAAAKRYKPKHNSRAYKSHKAGSVKHQHMKFN
jgi:hypothetical protein